MLLLNTYLFKNLSLRMATVSATSQTPNIFKYRLKYALHFPGSQLTSAASTNSRCDCRNTVIVRSGYVPRLRQNCRSFRAVCWVHRASIVGVLQLQLVSLAMLTWVSSIDDDNDDDEDECYFCNYLYHPRLRRDNVFSRVCLCVCRSIMLWPLTVLI